MACRRSLSFASCNEEGEGVKSFMNPPKINLFLCFYSFRTAPFAVSVFQQINLSALGIILLFVFQLLLEAVNDSPLQTI